MTRSKANAFRKFARTAKGGEAHAILPSPVASEDPNGLAIDEVREEVLERAKVTVSWKS